MYIKTIRKYCIAEQNTHTYFRLSESYRDEHGIARQRMVLGLGRLLELPDFDHKILFLERLNELIKGRPTLFSCKEEKIEQLAQHTDPVLINGYIYGYSGESSRNNGQFKCIELASGKEMWSAGEIGQGTITYVDCHLICLDIKGNLFLVKPEPSGFLKVGEIKKAIGDVKNPAWTVPVVANGKLYLRYLQQLVCYKLV